MVTDLAQRLRGAMGRAVVGREAEVSALLIGVLAEGHLLLEGPPGTAKTLLVRTLATVSGASYRRVQFTPDLMPADVMGTNVFEAATATFRLVRGPIFADFVLADEINRAPAKTQAALLESMEERQVTLDGTSQALPQLFTVFATMNPIEFEWTFPLPEAQLDRFLLKIPMAELSGAAELEVLARYARGEDPWALARGGLDAVATPAELLEFRSAARAIAIDSSVQSYLLEIVRRTRTHAAVAFGASTRAAVALLKASRARAALEGRTFVIPDDIKFLAPFVLAHRLSLRAEATMEEVDGPKVIRQILDQTPVPRATA